MLVAWHGMIWSNGDRSWWPRLDAARIICFGFQDFQNFPWFWDLQIPVEIFEQFQDFKSCNKETCVIFFHGQSLAEYWFVAWFFFCEFFRPNKMMDLLRPWQFQVSDFPFMVPSSVGFLRGFLLPGGQHDPSMWNGGQIFSLPGTVHSQNMVCNFIFNVTYAAYASMELLSAQNPCVLLLEPPAVPTWSTGKLEVEEGYPRSHASADLSDGFGVGNWF